MSNASTLGRHQEAGGETDDAAAALQAKEKERETLAIIDGCIDECRTLLQDPLMSAATRGEYERMFQDLRTDLKVEWAQGTAALIGQTIARARRDREQMLARAQENRRDALFVSSDLQELDEWFLHSDLMDLDRTVSWEARVETFLQKHAVIARRRAALMAKGAGLEEADAREIAALRDEKTFLALSVQERTNLLDRLEAMDLAAMAGKRQLYVKTDAMLREASTGEGRYVHPAATGSLLRQMMASRTPERFREASIVPSLNACKDTRSGFDAFAQRLATMDTPPIAIPVLDTFLQWSAPKRRSFIAEGERRARSADEAASRTEGLTHAKMLADTCMRREDWDKAEALLDRALRTFPDDGDLRVMRAYLDDHRENAETERREGEMRRMSGEIDAMIAAAPPELRTMYVAMAMQGPETFLGFAAAMERGVQRKQKGMPPLMTMRDNAPSAEEVIERDETPDGQRAAAQEILGRSPTEGVLIVDSLTQDAVGRVRQTNDALLERLRFLHANHSAYGMAA